MLASAVSGLRTVCPRHINTTPQIMYTQRHIILFDTEESHSNLLPLSFTRPVAEFRIGITTLREKWESLLPGCYSYRPAGYLRDKFGDGPEEDCDDCLFVSGSILPDSHVACLLEGLESGEALTDTAGVLRGCRGTTQQCRKAVDMGPEAAGFRTSSAGSLRVIRYVFDIFLRNAEMIAEDFERLTAGRRSAQLSDTVRVIGAGRRADSKIFVEEGASLECVTVNLKDGPVYIGRGVQIMEGASLRGPLAVCDNSKVKMGARIYGGTTFGPYCKVGGEVDNTVIFGYSNKAHDGYLGNAVIGEWCNIGAGTNASNLKNDYSKIRIWNYATHSFMRTDLQFCGLIMGDHSKAGINCMFNTATVVGVGCNIHGAGFPRVFIPSFSEGSATAGFSDVPMKKFCDIAERVMQRRNKHLNELDRHILECIREAASKFK